MCPLCFAFPHAISQVGFRVYGHSTLTGARAAQATCSAPYCLDMRNYPMFRNGACMCAAQTLAHVRELALAARDQSTRAAVGARSSSVMSVATLDPHPVGTPI